MTIIQKTTLLGLLALFVASAAQAQNIDCSGGCTETKYGMGSDLDWFEDLSPGAFNKEQWTGSHLFARLAPNLSGADCGPEGVTQPVHGQIILREQDGCVMDSVADGVGCLVEIPTDSALGRGGYVQLGILVLNLPIGIIALRQGLFAHFEGSIGERILDAGGGTRIHWGSEVGGALRLIRERNEGAQCCQSSTQTLCGIFGFAEYPLLETPTEPINQRVLTPDWVFDGGAGTFFELDRGYIVPGQEEGVCTANRSRPCGTLGDQIAGAANDKCIGAPPCNGRLGEALASACDDVAFGGVAGDTCDLSEQGFRPNPATLVTGGAPDTAKCNRAPIIVRGFPNENCWLDSEYPVNGDPLPGCQLWNIGRHMRPDQNCDGIEDDTDGDGQPGPDLCVNHSESNPFADANGDGIGDQCQCGDVNEDGAVTSVDIGGVALCANGAAACDFRISETDNDGSVTSLDIAGVVSLVNGNIQNPVGCGRSSLFSN